MKAADAGPRQKASPHITVNDIGTLIALYAIDFLHLLHRVGFGEGVRVRGNNKLFPRLPGHFGVSGFRDRFVRVLAHNVALRTTEPCFSSAAGCSHLLVTEYRCTHLRGNLLRELGSSLTTQLPSNQARDQTKCGAPHGISPSADWHIMHGTEHHLSIFP